MSVEKAEEKEQVENQVKDEHEHEAKIENIQEDQGELAIVATIVQALPENKKEKQSCLTEGEKKITNDPEKENIAHGDQKHPGQSESKQEKDQIVGQQPVFLCKDEIYPEQILPFQHFQAPPEAYGQHQTHSSQIHPLSNSHGIAKRKNKKRIITNPNQQVGHWSEREHKTYVNFLMAHKTIMESQDMKKTSKIFKLMSEIIGTRSPSQCRSHHQKFNPFVHHVKKRQKGAGRKRNRGALVSETPVPKKQEQAVESGNFDNSNAMLQQFMMQNPPFYMPQNYLQGGQNLGGFFQDQNLQQNPELNFAGGQSLFNFASAPPAQIQQLLRSVEQDELEKQQQQGGYLGMKDQLMMPQLQLPSIFQMPPPQGPQSNWYQQQFAMPNQPSDDKNQYYNFSFIQAPLSLNINYMAPQMFPQDGGMPDGKQMDPGLQHFPQFFPYFPDEQQHQMMLNQNNDVNKQ